MSVTEQEAIPEVVEDSQIDNQFTSILSTLSQFESDSVFDVVIVV